jgi:hypothetical protein
MPGRRCQQSLDEQMICAMFQLIRSNMIRIIPSSATKEEDYSLWRKAFDEGLKAGVEHIVDVRGGQLRGYLSYRNLGDSIHLSEFQVTPSSRDGTVFRALLSRFLRVLRLCSAEWVVTYANRQNRPSNSIIRKMGFSMVEETERGFRYRYRRTQMLARFRLLVI